MPISVKRPRSFPAVTAPLSALITLTLALEQRRAGEITVVLTDDATVRELNRRWRRIDRATDVLSFDYGEAPAGAKRAVRPRRPPAVHGDLAISIDRLREQAKRYRVIQGRELARLVVHGTLHLAGLDHHREAERRHMRSRERAALRAGGDVIRLLESRLSPDA
jgi:probable rRNA maturation factor